MRVVSVLHIVGPCHSELVARSLQRHLLVCQKVCQFYDPTERVEGNGNVAENDRDAALVVQVEAPAPAPVPEKTKEQQALCDQTHCSQQHSFAVKQ